MFKKILVLLIISSSCYSSSWECINRVIICHTWRMEVINGWIVSGDNSAGGSEHTYAMTFVPDPEHKWKL
jgi:hypothetical protein